MKSATLRQNLRVLIQVPKTLILLGMLSLISLQSHAQVIAPSAEEIQFSYSAQFVGDVSDSDSATVALDHASHMFGLFTSPTLIESFKLDSFLVGGIGAPRSQMKIKIIRDEDLGNGLHRIKYSNAGKILAHKKVAKALLKKQSLTLPLPADLTNFYDKNCTDEHYQELGDFWYFYDPFRIGCKYLSEAPMSEQVEFQFRPVTRQVSADITPRLDLLRGNNGNGDKFSIYVVNGYSESATNPRDDGRLEFKAFNKHLKELGFTEKILNRTKARPLHLYEKSIELSNGKVIQVEVKHILVETQIESRGVTFAKFFKEAVSNADVIIYGGHSGLGGNLDITFLEEKAGKFEFNSRKKQIFFFESCSSYSYYLEAFAAEKTKAKIDIVTNGLSSYFETSSAVVSNFMDILLDPDIEDASWMSILKSMEEPLEGATYLLNVGGL